MGAFQSTGYTSDDIERIKEEVRVQMRAAPCPECERLKGLAYLPDAETGEPSAATWEQEADEAYDALERVMKERDAALNDAQWNKDQLRAAIASAKSAAEEVARLRALLKRARDEMVCGAGGPGADFIERTHSCGRCDSYVDKNATLRREIDSALKEPHA